MKYTKLLKKNEFLNNKIVRLILVLLRNIQYNVHGEDKNNSAHNLFITNKIKYKRMQSLSGNHFQRNGGLHCIRFYTVQHRWV